MRMAAVSAIYAGFAFAAGFVLGTVRVLLLEPRLGAVGAVLIEGPIMLGVSFLAARWVVSRWMLHDTRSRRLGMGLLAFGMLLVLEFAIAPWANANAPGGWMHGFFAKFLTTAGVIGAGLQVGFGVMPGVVGGLGPVVRDATSR
jgi:hypothetical protein